MIPWQDNLAENYEEMHWQKTKKKLWNTRIRHLLLYLNYKYGLHISPIPLSQIVLTPLSISALTSAGPCSVLNRPATQDKMTESLGRKPHFMTRLARTLQVVWGRGREGWAADVSAPAQRGVLTPTIRCRENVSHVLVPNFRPYVPPGS